MNTHQIDHIKHAMLNGGRWQMQVFQYMSLSVSISIVFHLNLKQN